MSNQLIGRPAHGLLGLLLYVLLGWMSLTHAQSNDSAYFEGKSLFLKTVPACSICHTLNDAIGPVLDEIKPSAERVAKALRNGIGNMPSFGAKLSDGQVEALARYVSKASGGSP